MPESPLPQEELLAINERVVRHAKNILTYGVLDQIVYYSNHPDTASSVVRSNCLDQAVSLRDALRSDPNLPIQAQIVPFDAEPWVYTPSQISQYPFAHIALDLKHNSGQPMGLIDPSYGIFFPLQPGSVRRGRGWDIQIEVRGSEFHYVGRIPEHNRSFDMRFYPDQPLATTEAISRHQSFLRQFLANHAYAYAQSPETGLKLVTLDISREHIRLLQTSDSKNVIQVPTLSTNPSIVAKLSADFCSRVNSVKTGIGATLDPENFLSDVTHFIHQLKSQA